MLLNDFSGFYYYTEITGFEPGTRYLLTSASLADHMDNTAVRLSFWCHMYGHHIGNLSVYAILESGEMEKVLHVSGMHHKGLCLT